MAESALEPLSPKASFAQADAGKHLAPLRQCLQRVEIRLEVEALRQLWERQSSQNEIEGRVRP